MPHDQRAYRVQGTRPDGTVQTRDFLQLEKAEKAASKMLVSRTEFLRGEWVTYPALSNVRITRSAPIRWLYPEGGTQ